MKLASMMCVVGLAAACDSGGGGSSGGPPPAKADQPGQPVQPAKAGQPTQPAKAGQPTQPANGAPMALEVVKINPGTDRRGSVKVKGYNFSDKNLAGYTVAVRYTDKAGAPIMVGDKDVAWTSMQGMELMCKAKSWCSFEIDIIEVPAEAAKAEAAITSATAVQADGVTMEERWLWSSDKGMSAWPL